VFVVDEAHPAGYDASVHFTAADGLLWNLDRQDDHALLVVVAGTEAITGQSLDEVLTSVEHRSDVHVGVRGISPPMR
jgi:type II secretory pathway predicted ATPase ExeA